MLRAGKAPAVTSMLGLGSSPLGGTLYAWWLD
jgi:hypothetical protein